MKKVLSIDGGGIRGIIPAMVLAEIEARTGKRSAEMFDLVAGTSTGGILALVLTKPGQVGKAEYSAERLKRQALQIRLKKAPSAPTFENCERWF